MDRKGIQSLFSYSFGYFHIVCFLFLMFNRPLIVTGDDSATVDSESFVDVVTNGINRLESKVDNFLGFGEATKIARNTAADPFTENKICSLTSRVIELENEIDALRSFLPSSSLAASSASFGGSTAVISDLQSMLSGLQNSFKKQELKITELERRFQQLGRTDDLPSPEDEAVTGFCDVHSLGLRELETKSLLQHLQRISFNVFLKKPSNSSSLYPKNSSNYKTLHGLDENFTSYFHSGQESNPYFFLDLEVPHLIWEMRLTVREVTRSGGIKIYLANNLEFDYYGKPKVNSLPVFGSQVGNSDSITIQFTSPGGGMCGRYVIVVREVLNEYLIIKELQGTGYAFR